MSGVLYMTEEFAKYLAGKDVKDRFNSTKHYIIYNSMYKCTLYVRKFSGLQNEGFEKFKYYLAGSSGSHGFNGLEYTKREKLGIRTVRRANKYVFDLYQNSYFSRQEKIEIIISSIEHSSPSLID